MCSLFCQKKRKNAGIRESAEFVNQRCVYVSQDCTRQRLWQEKVLDQWIDSKAKEYLRWEDKEPDTYRLEMTGPEEEEEEDDSDGAKEAKTEEGNGASGKDSKKDSTKEGANKEQRSGVVKLCSQHQGGEASKSPVTAV